MSRPSIVPLRIRSKVLMVRHLLFMFRSTDHQTEYRGSSSKDVTFVYVCVCVSLVSPSTLEKFVRRLMSSLYYAKKIYKSLNSSSLRFHFILYVYC